MLPGNEYTQWSLYFYVYTSILRIYIITKAHISTYYSVRGAQSGPQKVNLKDVSQNLLEVLIKRFTWRIGYPVI